jgi:hypothetical protein
MKTRAISNWRGTQRRNHSKKKLSKPQGSKNPCSPKKQNQTKPNQKKKKGQKIS